MNEISIITAKQAERLSARGAKKKEKEKQEQAQAKALRHLKMLEAKIPERIQQACTDINRAAEQGERKAKLREHFHSGHDYPDGIGLDPMERLSIDIKKKLFPPSRKVVEILEDAGYQVSFEWEVEPDVLESSSYSLTVSW